MRMNKGFPATVISEDTMRPKDADFAGGYLVQSLGVVPVTFFEAGGEGGAGFGVRRWWTTWSSTTTLRGSGVNGDCLPYEDNKLFLSDERDEFGVPRAQVDFSYGDNERRMRDHAAKLMTECWEAAGAKDIWTFERSAHTIGTCRMGTDAGKSVVDSFGRSHDVANLWISDNSTFPSAVAANPALTIMALAVRSAREFLRVR